MAAGVAIAAAVLTGALLVGASVRASLRDLVLQRLGHTQYAATGVLYFREQLAAETNGCPLIVTEAAATNATSKRRASAVFVYGVDERFWKFHGVAEPAGIAISPGLAAEIGAGELLLRMEKPSAIPKESLHGRKDEGRTIRFTPGGVLDPKHLGEFSLRPQQGPVLAIFVPLRRLQRELSEAGRVNAILYDAASAPTLKGKVTLADLGIRLRPLVNQQQVAVESDAAIINDALAEAAGPEGQPVFSYLANSIRIGSREIPYSLVTAVDRGMLSIEPGGIVLNEWAALELSAKPGERVQLDFFAWGDGGNLLTRSASFTLSGIVPIRGIAADRELTPEYPGITQAKNLRDWDPPFPMNLARIRPADERYWDEYRTTPKAFIGLEAGEKLWGSRFGRMTSIRFPAAETESLRKRLLERLDPASFGLMVYSPRSTGTQSAHGSTDFGEYFTYFSFFLVVSALLLAALFFRLGVEQRMREIGTLRALGWSTGYIRRAFLVEGAILGALGSLAGTVGAMAYCAFVLYGLRTWWRGAVGTTALTLHVDAASLLIGYFAGIATAVLVIWWTLRSLRKLTPRALLVGSDAAATRATRPWVRWVALLVLVTSIALAGAGFGKTTPAAAAFFGAGSLLTIAALMLQSIWLRAARHDTLGLSQAPSLWRLGFRNASHRPGRSILCIALIATAVFLLVALDTFRQQGGSSDSTGSFQLLAESQLPIFWDPNTTAGRDSLNLTPVQDKLAGVHMFAFRLHPGEDASCLNLYEPRNPRVLGARTEFVKQNRFKFAASSSAATNPWTLLEREAAGAIPAIADANSIEYVLHKKLGDEFLVNGFKLRLVGALQDSALQSEIIVSERNFIHMFPDDQGYRFFAIDAPSAATGAVLEEALSDYGFDATPTADRVAAYHRVENTYLSTFQALGALGLLLGTVGLAAVLLRNVLERRRELALLSALGYRRSQLSTIIVTENAFLAFCGLATGIVSAAVAVTPAAIGRGGVPAAGGLAIMLIAVAATALLSSLLAVRAVQRAPLLSALRAE